MTTVAVSSTDPAKGNVPAAGQPADLFLGADWGGVSGRGGIRGDWAPWVQFVADPQGTDVPAFRNVFPEDVERAGSLYRQQALAYTAAANTYKALWLDWSQGLSTLAVALGAAAEGDPLKEPTSQPGLPAAYPGLQAPADLAWPSDDAQLAMVESPVASTFVYGGWGSPVAKAYDATAGGWTVYGAMGQDQLTDNISNDYVGLSIGDARGTYGTDVAAPADAYLLATVVVLKAQSGAKYRYQTGAGKLGAAKTKFNAWTVPL